MTTSEDLWVRAKEIQRTLKISPSTVRRWRIEGILKSKRVNGVRFYNIGAFLAKLAE